MTLTIRITNDGTGPNNAANYNYTVESNFELIEKGRLEGFDRLDGWLELVRWFMKAEDKKLADYQKKNPPKDTESTGKYCVACGAELKYRNATYMCVRPHCRKYGKRA